MVLCARIPRKREIVAGSTVVVVVVVEIPIACYLHPLPSSLPNWDNYGGAGCRRPEHGILQTTLRKNQSTPRKKGSIFNFLIPLQSTGIIYINLTVQIKIYRVTCISYKEGSNIEGGLEPRHACFPHWHQHNRMNTVKQCPILSHIVPRV